MDFLLDDPIVTVVAFYVFVFTAAEVARNAVDMIAPISLRVYLYEAIATMSMCLCVFENGFMLAYGYLAFFLTVSVVLHMGARLNRGAQVSPLGSFESLYYGNANTAKILGILFSQLIAAVGAFLLVGHLWIISGDYFSLHRGKVDQMINKCHISYKVPFTFVVLFEFFGCALIRILVPLLGAKLHDSVKLYVIPAFIAGMITSSIYLLGAAGLNPVVASCRLIWCGGIDKQWFILLYWGISTLGSLFGALISRKLFPAMYKLKNEKPKAKQGGKREVLNKQTEKKKKAKRD